MVVEDVKRLYRSLEGAETLKSPHGGWVGGNQYPSIDRRATRSLAMQIEVQCACTVQGTLLYKRSTSSPSRLQPPLFRL